MKRTLSVLTIMLVLGCFFSMPIYAGNYIFTTLDYPGSPHDVDGSNVVGDYGDGDTVHGFLYDGTTWTLLDYPGADSTHADGIDGGNIVGDYYADGYHGFLYDGTTYTPLDCPGAVETLPLGIDGSNIVGHYYDGANVHGFLYDGTTWTSLDYPGADTTYCWDIDGSNIVGRYTDVDGNLHGFLYDGTTWTSLDYPGIDGNTRPTWARGIDGSNIVGVYLDGTGFHGFLYDGTTWTSLDYPGAVQTHVNGIDGSNIVGTYSYSASPHGDSQGFIATYVPSAEEQIEDIQDFFRESVINGDLSGLGATETAAAGKLGALENMLEEAEYLIENGFTEEACNQLNAIYMKIDGATPPPDFVIESEVASELADKILALMDILGCE